MGLVLRRSNCPGRTLGFASPAVGAVVLVHNSLAFINLDGCGGTSIHAGPTTVTQFLVHYHCHDLCPFAKKEQDLIQRPCRGLF